MNLQDLCTCKFSPKNMLYLCGLIWSSENAILTPEHQIRHIYSNLKGRLMFNTPVDITIRSMNKAAVSFDVASSVQPSSRSTKPTHAVIWGENQGFNATIHFSHESVIRRGSDWIPAGTDEGLLWPLPHLSPFTLQPVESRTQWDYTLQKKVPVCKQAQILVPYNHQLHFTNSLIA